MYDYSQNKSQWLSIKDFNERKNKFANSIITSFQNDYAQHSFRENRLWDKRKSAIDFGSRLQSYRNEYRGNHRSIIVQKKKDDRVANTASKVLGEFLLRVFME